MKKTKEIITRSITGTALVLAILFAIISGGLYFSAFFLLIAVLGSFEYFRMLKGSTSNPQIIVGTLFTALTFILLSLAAQNYIQYKYLFIIVLMWFFIPIRELYRKQENPIANIATTLFGIIYLGVTLGLIQFMFLPQGTPHPYIWVLAMFVILWTSDTFAYLSGIRFGKHRLFERISPKKSWEGFFGGLAASLVAGYLFSLFFIEFQLWQWLAYALIISVAGVFGDLVQSLFKRSLGIKDTGTILPGHGGILDRFDAVFFAVPAAVAFIWFFI